MIHCYHLPTCCTKGLPNMKKPHYLLISALVLTLDQWSKHWVETSIESFRSIEIIPGWFQLIYTKNTGIAFGLFPSHGRLFGTILLATLGLFALVLVGTLFTRTPSKQSLLLLALALVLGGAVGNLTDRVLLGAVTDFLDVYWGTHHFPTFNIADSAISVGIVFLAWDSLFGRDRHEVVDDESMNNLQEVSDQGSQPA